MGSGKTEAALAASYHLIERGQANGLYFALPTQVTSNRIHLRVRQFLERSLDVPVQVRLAHSP
jgi:CRISPR-associated endonuclease/helicase Cas3